MGEAEILDALRSSLWAAFAIALPILMITLVVGMAIGLFQALTSIQELTLTFVPKLGAIFLTFWLTMGFMGQTMVSFFQTEIISRIEAR